MTTARDEQAQEQSERMSNGTDKILDMADKTSDNNDRERKMMRGRWESPTKPATSGGGKSEKIPCYTM